MDRTGFPWWAPLLAPLALAVVAVAVTVRGDHGSSAQAAATTTARVAGVQVTHRRRAPKPARAAARPAKHAELRAGTLAAEHSVRVLDIVGPRIFWIGKNKATRRLVHVQGRGTRWGLRPGQRLTFTAVVARNRPGAARAWGLTRREGRDQLDRQGTHFEVYGPRIRFLCVRRCTR